MSITDTLNTLTPGTAVKFSVSGADQNGVRIGLTENPVFISECPDIATVTVDPDNPNSATITAVIEGATTLVVRHGEVSWSSPINVVAATLTSLSVTQAE